MTSLASYADVRRVWDTALKRGTLTYELPTRGAAVNFRQRCYRFRAELHKISSEQLAGIPGTRPSSPYDHLIIVLEANKLVFKERELVGKLLDEEGNPIELEPEAEPETDTLENAAAEARRNLGLDVE